MTYDEALQALCEMSAQLVTVKRPAIFDCILNALDLEREQWQCTISSFYDLIDFLYAHLQEMQSGTSGESHSDSIQACIDEIQRVMETPTPVWRANCEPQ